MTNLRQNFARCAARDQQAAHTPHVLSCQAPWLAHLPRKRATPTQARQRPSARGHSGTRHHQANRELTIAVVLLVLAIICSSLSYVHLQRTAETLDQQMEHVANSRLSH